MVGGWTESDPNIGYVANYVTVKHIKNRNQYTLEEEATMVRPQRGLG